MRQLKFFAMGVGYTLAGSLIGWVAYGIAWGLLSVFGASAVAGFAGAVACGLVLYHFLAWSSTFIGESWESANDDRKVFMMGALAITGFSLVQSLINFSQGTILHSLGLFLGALAALLLPVMRLDGGTAGER